MNNSNNFNICEKCGTANPIVAKYCYQCGGQLRTPEDPLVCPKCNTVNSGSARFCKFCGTKLYRGNSIKICPRCNHTVSGDAIRCDRCQFEFLPNAEFAQQQVPTAQISATRPFPVQQNSAVPYQAPQQPYPQRPNSPQQPAYAQNNMTVATNALPKSAKQGKAIIGGVLMVILFLLLAYLALGIQKIQIESLYDKGIYSYLMSSGHVTGSDIITSVTTMIKFVWTDFSQIGAFFADMVEIIKIMPVFMLILIGYVSVMILTVLICFIINLVRIFTGRCAKHSAWGLLVLAIITGLIALIFFLATNSSSICQKIATFLYGAVATVAPKPGLLMYIIPCFFLVTWLLSLCFKSNKIESIMDIKR